MKLLIALLLAATATATVHVEIVQDTASVYDSDGGVTCSPNCQTYADDAGTVVQAYSE